VNLQARMAELRTRFIERAGHDRLRIEQALAEGDLLKVHDLSHRLHGIAGTFGFHSLTAAAAALEDAIDEQRADVDAYANRLLSELAEIA
jgi:HPt (histidine-containing phosphotransfer) domain-containing protein